MTLQDYNKKINSITVTILGWHPPVRSLLVAVGLIPLFPKYQKYSSILVPPIKSYSALEVAIFEAAIALAILGSYLAREELVIPWVRKLLFGVVILLVLSQGWFWLERVHTQDTPNTNASLTVVTGFVRKPETVNAYPGASDEEILDSEGGYDATVTRLWTPKSVFLARALGIGIYALLGASSVFLVASFAMEESLNIDLDHVASASEGEDD